MHRRAIASLVGLAIALSGAPAGALDLPAVETLLGTQDPLRFLPDRLPERGAFQLSGDWRRWYRSERGDRLHDYSLRAFDSGGWLRIGESSWWAGMATSGDELTLRQDDFYTGDDALDGGRRIGHLAGALAWRREPWQARVLVGGVIDDAEGRSGGVASEGLEFAAEVRGRVPGLSHWRARGWSWQSRVDLAQRIDDTTFFFPFGYRDDTVDLSLTTRAWRGFALQLGGRRTVHVGEKPDPEQYNAVYLRRYEGRWGVTYGRWALCGIFDRHDVDVAMVLSGTRFLDVDDLRFRRTTVGLEREFASRWRTGIDFERRTIAGPESSFADAWPFTAWDVLLAQRYRLRVVDRAWNSYGVWASYAKSRPSLSRADWTGGLELRLERWDDEGSLLWTERSLLFPPFVFQTDSHEESLDWRFTWATQLDADFRWHMTAGLELWIEGQLIVPLGDDRPDEGGGGGGGGGPAGPPEPEEKVSGGLRLRSGVAWTW